jgi:hypothetical protein
MKFRQKLRQITESLGAVPCPVDIEDQPAKKIQIAIAQITDGGVRTVIANGKVFAWKEQ